MDDQGQDNGQGDKEDQHYSLGSEVDWWQEEAYGADRGGVYVRTSLALL